MPRPSSRKLALEIDAERRALEARGIRASTLIASRARRAAFAAFRSGHDPRQAVHSVLLGDPRYQQPGIAPTLADGMLAAHLMGRKRTEIQVAPQFTASDKMKLAGTTYDGALDFLKRRLELTEDDLAGLQARYNTEALRVLNTATASLEQGLQQAVIESTAAGEGVTGGVKALRQAFVSEGMAPDANYRLEAVFRTQTQIAYSAGRVNAWADPAIQEILWGYEYAAVEDDRVTELCESLNGTKRPKDDPFWSQFMPPNHFNCRSTALEIFNDEKIAESTEIPEGLSPAGGFNFNPGNVFRDLLPAT